MTPGRLIVITGPAAAGKSTLARALQSHFARHDELWLVFELDAFGRGMPRDWIALGKHRGEHAAQGFDYVRSDDRSLELILGSDGRRVLASFHRAVAAAVRSGVNVVCETIVYDDDDWNDWADALRDIRTCWVRLSASLAVIDAREKAERAPLFHGLGRGMSARLANGTFSVEADTGTESTNTVVERVVASLTT
jgi:chloramphenicol 3-O-phosphotransferase